MILEIIEQKDFIIIRYSLDDDDADEYEFPIHLITDTRKDSCSEVIIGLLEKKWVNESKNRLYELAKVIAKHDVDRKIDWTETFFTVEKDDYLKTINNHDNNTNFLDIVKTNLNESSENEVMEALRDLADRKIKEYKII